MKRIISQTKNQFITCAPGQVYNIATVEQPRLDGGETDTPPLFSVGINGVSVGVFEDQNHAFEVLSSISLFMDDKNTRFYVPECKPKKGEE
ncbi:MAG: hypothetical protein FWB80_00150 [Defluviitaleaceae bacterium]|nr:hypothetical protein [Defluviitaleaceae bacterium]